MYDPTVFGHAASGVVAAGPCNHGWQGEGGWNAKTFYGLVEGKEAAKFITATSKPPEPVAIENKLIALICKEQCEKGPRAFQEGSTFSISQKCL